MSKQDNLNITNKDSKELHWLEQLSADEDMTLYELAINSGIHKNSFYSMISRGTEIQNVKGMIIYQLAKCLGYNMEEFFEKYLK